MGKIVRFYQTEDGKSPVKNFLDSLPGKVAQKVLWVLMLVEELDALPTTYFKIGVTLRKAREAAGPTQEELAVRLKTKKTAISRIENHAEHIKLSTLERVAAALGKRLVIIDRVTSSPVSRFFPSET